MKSEFSVVRSYRTAIEAHAAKHFLEANGIPAFVLDEYSSESWWNTVEIKIQVPVDQAQDALALLDTEKIIPSNTPMRFRKLRIAWSVGCAIACLFLLALWVASYNNFATTDQFVVASNVELTVEFYHGRTALIFSPPGPQGSSPMWLLDYPIQNGNKLPGIAGFALLRTPIVGDVYMFPFWFPVLLAVTAVTAPWLRYRFSLRTLLIATTLVAGVLGLVVWAAK